MFTNKLNNLQDKLYRFAYKLTGDETDAKDLLQDTNVRALLYRQKYKPDNFDGWLYTIMRSIFINNYRRKAKRHEHRELYFDYVNKTVLEPDQIISEKEIMSSISLIPELHRIPFMMFYEGFLYKEIADRLGTNINTVKSRIRIARRLISKELKK
jgi:RNA polymerase sigma-70 factor, ECF subfamily